MNKFAAPLYTAAQLAAREAELAAYFASAECAADHALVDSYAPLDPYAL